MRALKMATSSKAYMLRLHPAIPLGCMIDCAVGAWLGHDGFRWPGAGAPRFFFRVPLFRGLVAGVFLEMEGLRLWQISTISLNWQWT